MNQLGDKASYSEIPLDETGAYKDLGVFSLKTLNDLLIQHKDLPGITNPQLPSTAVPGYSKIVGNITTFGTRLTQTENEIDLLAIDVGNSQAQLTIQAGQITSLVSGVAGNTSSITQNSNSIASLVTQTNSNYSLIQQNSSAISLEVTNRTNADSNLQSQITVNAGNINLKVSKNDVVNQINISTEGIKISASKIQIDGTTTFASGYNPSVVQSNLTDLQNNLGDVAYADKIEYAMLSTTTIISGGYIRTNLLDVQDIFAQNVDVYGELTVSGTGGIFVGGTGTGAFFYNTGNGPGMEFYDSNQFAGSVVGNGFKDVTVGSFNTTLACIEISGNIYVGTDMIVGDDLVVTDDVWIGGSVMSDLVMGSTADIVLGGTGSRIYDSSKVNYIYYNGTAWVVKDSAGTHTI